MGAKLRVNAMCTLLYRPYILITLQIPSPFAPIHESQSLLLVTFMLLARSFTEEKGAGTGTNRSSPRPEVPFQVEVSVRLSIAPTSQVQCSGVRY
jgi:hypothetical protein